MRRENPKGKIHRRRRVQSRGMSHVHRRQSELGGRLREGWAHRPPHVCSAGSPLPEDRSADEEPDQDAISGALITTTPSDCAGTWPVSVPAGQRACKLLGRRWPSVRAGCLHCPQPPRPTLHTEDIQQSFAESCGRKEEGIRCLGHWLHPSTWACPAKGRLHAAPICTAPFYKFSL